MLRVNHLTYNYLGITYRYDLTLEASQIAAVLGKSGSGKSTLLDLLGGFLKPQSGEIILDGIHLEDQPISKRKIAILFQNNNLFEHLSVAQNLTIGLKQKPDIKTILKEVGLEGYEDRYASQLSGGEQQRVALARTLLRQSRILLLDEPFSALDSHNRHAMLNLIRRITDARKLHTIFITHNLEDSHLIADKCYEMQHYQLTACTSTRS